MSILKIARMGHPVLRRPAAPVADPTTADIARLVADMTETMIDAQGAGLAAPQVHVPLRVVIFHAPAHRLEKPSESVPLTVLINPEITPLSDETADDWEGCLSVPGLTALVPRWERIRYTALTPDGAQIDREAEGFHARVVQHECDHLDGILYPQRMTDMGHLMFREELRHYMSDTESSEDE